MGRVVGEQEGGGTRAIASAIGEDEASGFGSAQAQKWVEVGGGTMMRLCWWSVVDCEIWGGVDGLGWMGCETDGDMDVWTWWWYYYMDVCMLLPVPVYG